MFSQYVFLFTAAYGAPIVLDPIDRARSFEGVGGISGGGATSRLLIDYPEPKYSQLLDILYTPQNAAAFSTIKVEIPADSDTTCGSEVAHRHDRDDGGSCTRGYEGIHLAAANARRPGITSSSLQWAAPHFVGEADVDNGKSLFTATNINEYVIPWLKCMKEAYNISLTWQGGGWNERPHNNSYIKLMRQSLDAAGLSSTGIAAADQCCGAGWNIINDLVGDPALRASVAVVSTHCAGSMNNQDTPQAAIDLGIPLFQGEEHIGLPGEWGGGESMGGYQRGLKSLTPTHLTPPSHPTPMYSLTYALHTLFQTQTVCPFGSGLVPVPRALK
jgi:galactosylceramidase